MAEMTLDRILLTLSSICPLVIELLTTARIWLITNFTIGRVSSFTVPFDVRAYALEHAPLRRLQDFHLDAHTLVHAEASPGAGPYTNRRVKEGVFRHFPSPPPEMAAAKWPRMARDKKFPVTPAPAGRPPNMRTAEREHHRRGKRRRNEKARR
ncbi:hypothetical protein N7494_008399 [Penicillium frequentans]|uniref:Uncharacterized protein n=1 Tax=Penicillium frequentans TaxID=3151616 RepID=A0AAD6CUY6_9EURO|nr:hypothetical protein N7494_008399 [Penicillium glabrum]